MYEIKLVMAITIFTSNYLSDRFATKLNIVKSVRICSQLSLARTYFGTKNNDI